MATLNFTGGTPSATTKLVGFDSAVAGGERTYTVGDIKDAPSSVVPLGNITGAVTLDRANGAAQNAAATGNVTVNVSNGADGDSLELWLIASGADRTFSKDASVKISGDSAITFPVTLPSGTGASILFKKHGAVWNITSFIKNIPTS